MYKPKPLDLNMYNMHDYLKKHDWIKITHGQLRLRICLSCRAIGFKYHSGENGIRELERTEYNAGAWQRIERVSPGVKKLIREYFKGFNLGNDDQHSKENT